MVAAPILAGATSTDGGNTWTLRLPARVLTLGEGSGPYTAASYLAAVADDAKHGVWMIALSADWQHCPCRYRKPLRPTGFTWQNPVSVDPGVFSSDKNWIVCDSGASSPYYGNCYVEWDDPSSGDQIFSSAPPPMEA